MPKKALPVFIQKALSTKEVPKRTIDAIKNDIRAPPPGFVFMTQTIKPSLYKMCAHNQFMTTIHDMRSMLDYFSSDYCLATEITKDGNVHYHYWIIFKGNYSVADIIDATKRNKKLGYTLASRMVKQQSHRENSDAIYNYMSKSIEETYRFIRNRHIVIYWDNMDWTISELHVEYDTSILDFMDINEIEEFQIHPNE